MIVTPANREEHLRSKSRFYVAGWVASEIGDTPQDEPTENKPEYKEYIEGFGEEKRNAFRLSLPPFNVALTKSNLV